MATFIKSSQLEDNIKVKGTLNVESLSVFKGDVVVNTRVGIGTSSPQAELHISSLGNAKFILEADRVNGSNESTHPVIELSQDGGLVKGILGYRNGDNNLYLESYASDNTTGMVIVTGGSSKVFVNNIGNVGIGVSNPTEKLHVNGKVKIQENSLSAESVTFETSSGVGLRLQNQYGYVNLTPLNTGWLHFYTDRANFIFDKDVWSISGGFHSYYTSDMRLYTHSNERVIIKNDSGNVGIGISVPTEKLHVSGNIKSSGSAVVGTTLGVGTNATIGGTLGVGTNTTIGGTLGVTGNTTLANTSINGTLGVSGNTTLSTLSVNGLGTFTNNISVGGGVTIEGTLGVSGDTTLNNLTSNTVSVSTTLGVNGATTLGGTLLGKEGVTFNKTLSVVGTTTLGILGAGTTTLVSLGVSGSSTLANLDVSGSSTHKTLVVGDLSTSSGELAVFQGDFGNNDSWITFGKYSGGDYYWRIKHIGSTAGTGGNELRFESVSSGKYYQMDHDGNLDYYDGTSAKTILSGSRGLSVDSASVGGYEVLTTRGNQTIQGSVDGSFNSLNLKNTYGGTNSTTLLRLYDDTGSNAGIFRNSSTRTSDGGVKSLNIYNDGGVVYLRGASGITLGSNTTISGTLSVGGNLDVGTNKLMFNNSSNYIQGNSGVATLAMSSYGNILIQADSDGNSNTNNSEYVQIKAGTSNEGLKVSSNNLTYNGKRVAMGDDGTPSWVCPVKCATWSRLFYLSGMNVIGHNTIFSIRATRGNVVYNITFSMSCSHNYKCSITQIGNTGYSQLKIRGVVNPNGDCYVEIYDNANSATNTITQNFDVSMLNLSNGTLTSYTSFTDGTTIPEGYVVGQEISSVSSGLNADMLNGKRVEDLLGSYKSVTKTVASGTGYYTFATMTSSKVSGSARFRICVSSTTNSSIIQEFYLKVFFNGNTTPTIITEGGTYSTSAATTGIRYIRCNYPKVVGNGYDYSIEFNNYDSTSRTIFIQLLDSNNIDLLDSVGDVSLYNSTYHYNTLLTVYAYRGISTNGTYYGTASYANSSGSTSYIYKSNILVEETVVANDLVGLTVNGKWRKLGTSGNEFAIPTMIARVDSTYTTASSGVGSYLNYHVSTLVVTPISISAGRTMYVRGRISSGKFISDGVFTDTLVDGYTYLKIGTAMNGTSIYIDTSICEYVTLSNGLITQVDGLGIDADRLDGKESSVSSVSNTIVVRDEVGDVYSRNVIVSNDFGLVGTLSDGTTSSIISIGSDDKVRLGYNSRDVVIYEPHIQSSKRVQFTNGSGVVGESQGINVGSVLISSDYSDVSKVPVNGLYVGGITRLQNKVIINQQSGTNDPTIDLAIGDADTGISWVSDGVFRLMSNSSEIMRINNTSVSISKPLSIVGNTNVIGTLSSTSNMSVGGTLGVSGVTTLSNTLSVSESVTFSKGLSVGTSISSKTLYVGDISSSVGEWASFRGNVATSDGWITFGEYSSSNYYWRVKYVGSTDGLDGNEFRIESANTNKYYQIDHNGNFDYFDGTSNYTILSGTRNLSNIINLSSSKISSSYISVSSSFTDLVNNSPWYGIGMSNLVGGLGNKVQVAGHFGLHFRTSGNTLDIPYVAGVMTYNDGMTLGNTLTVSSGYVAIGSGNVVFNSDNTGVNLFGGAKIYKKSGAGVVIKPENATTGFAVSNGAGTSNVLFINDAKTTIYNALDVSGGVSLKTTLDVVGVTTLSSFTSSGNGSVGGTLGVTGVATFVDNVSVGKILSVSGSGSVVGDFSVGGVLTVGSISITKDLGVGGNLSVVGSIGGNSLSIVNNGSIGGTLDVTGLVTLSGGLTVSVGTTSLKNTGIVGTLSASENVTLSKGLSVGTNTTIGGTLGVTGATTLSSTLGVSGVTTLSSTLGVMGATTLSSTLWGKEAVTFSKSLVVGTTLGVTGATTLSSTLGVTGATTLSSTLGVTGATTLSSTLGVGGATTLSNTLTVNGASTFNGTMNINANINNWKAGTNFYMTPSANAQEWSFDFRDIGTYTGNYWQVWTDKDSIGTVLAVTADTGRVGIRTSSPQENLHIDGNIAYGVSGSSPNKLLGLSNETWIVGRNTATHSLILGNNYDNDKSISLEYTHGTIGGGLGVLKFGQLRKNNTNYTHGVTSFYTNGVEQVRITKEGRLGVGVDSPSGKLHVKGINVSNSHYNTEFSHVIFENDEGNIQIIGNDGGNHSSSISLSSSPSTGVNKHWSFVHSGIDRGNRLDIGYLTTSGSGSIWESTTKSLTLLTNGNIGIGNVSPSSILEIGDSSRTLDSIIKVQSKAKAGIELVADSDNVGSEGDNAYVLFNQDGNSVRSIIGNVGDSDRSPTNEVYSGTIANGSLFGTLDNNSLHLGTYSNVRMTINGSGYVGIGTNYPTEMLHINGNLRGNQTGGAVRINTSYGYVNIGPQNADWMHFVSDRSAYYFDKRITINGVISSFGTNDLKFVTGHTNPSTGVTRVTIKNDSGNMGIGTESPSEKLEVDGKVKVKDGVTVADSSNSSKFEMVYNSTTKSLDFNFLG